LKNRSLFAQLLGAQSILCGLLIAAATLGLTACGPYYYKFPEFTFANRPIPPSKLANRVMVSVSTNGTQGSLQILDAKRDIRSNVENTIPFFSVSGYSSGYPNLILSFPAEIQGYVYSDLLGDVQIVNYGTESATPLKTTFAAKSAGFAVPPTFGHIYSAQPTAGQLVIVDNTSTAGIYALNLPNVDQVVSNQGDTIVLAMVRNSNTVYRLFKLNSNQYTTSVLAAQATGATDCEPFNLPIYCVVPVNINNGSAQTNTFDRPTNAYFSLDGTAVYVMNCGAECGGTTSSLTFLQPDALNVNNIPKAVPDTSAFLSNLPLLGGATIALEGTSGSTSTLYVAGQSTYQLNGNNQPVLDGTGKPIVYHDLAGNPLFAGYLSVINLSTLGVTTYSISDGTHSKLLFADNNTLWIGSHACANGERAFTGQNYNCLTRFDLGALSAQIIPNVTPGGTTTVPFPNTNQNQYYYGDLTGLCWVQGFNKVYTAYGGQVHAFNTVDGSEINNQFITVQGTALDVAYMDAITDAAN
jgi:hypothetical protein